MSAERRASQHHRKKLEEGFKRPVDGRFVEKIMEDKHDAILKRTRHIIDPFTKHPLFFLIDASTFPNGQSIGSTQGLEDRAHLEVQDRMRVREMTRIAAEYGYTVLSNMLKQQVFQSTVAEMEYKGREAIFEGMVLKTALNEYAEDPAIMQALCVLRTTINQLPSIANENDNEMLFIEESERVRVVFATVVGYTQVIAQERLKGSLDLENHQNRKYGVRDQVLRFGMTSLTLSGQQEVADYLISLNSG